jgi:hypothetical protein
MPKSTSKTIIIILLVFFSYYLPAQEKIEKKLNTNPGSLLKDIQPLFNKEIKIPEEYNRGGFMIDGDLLYFEAPDENVKLKSNFHFSKYIICNKEGEIINKHEKVVLWDHGSLMLKINILNSLLLVNLQNNFQRIINIDLSRLNNISINPFNKTIIYTYLYGNKVYEYNILHRRSRCLVELLHGNLMVLFQISPHELIYIRPNVSIKFMNQYDMDPSIRVEVPVYLANLKRERWGILTKLSSSGILIHYNEEQQDITFVVEEKGYLKFINSKSIGKYKTLKVAHLNHNTRETFEGLLLNHSEMNSKADLLVSSRIKVKKKKLSDSGDFEFISVDAENYIPLSGDIYILDMDGNYKKLTNTADQIEVLNDWSDKEDEILYYDFKNKLFHIMELQIGGKFRKRPFKTTPDKVKKI